MMRDPVYCPDYDPNMSTADKCYAILERYEGSEVFDCSFIHSILSQRYLIAALRDHQTLAVDNIYDKWMKFPRK